MQLCGIWIATFTPLSIDLHPVAHGTLRSTQRLTVGSLHSPAQRLLASRRGEDPRRLCGAGTRQEILPVMPHSCPTVLGAAGTSAVLYLQGPLATMVGKEYCGESESASRARSICRARGYVVVGERSGGAPQCWSRRRGPPCTGRWCLSCGPP